MKEQTIDRALRLGGRLSRSLNHQRYIPMDMVFRGLYQQDRSRRKRMINNYLHSSFAPDLSAAKQLAARSFREYGRTMEDFIWASHCPPEVLRRDATLIGLRHLDEAVAEGHGAIVAMNHFGSWDMAGALSLSLGIPVTTVMNDIGSPGMTNVVEQFRQTNGLQVLHPDNAARGILRALRDNRYVAILMDIPGDESPTVVVPYCGGRVAVSSVPWWFARRTGVPIVPLVCWRVGHGYTMEIFPPRKVRAHEAAEETMSWLCEVFTSVISRDPAQWYPFHDLFVD